MRYAHVPISGEAIVVAFDMCSSSDVIEEVTLGGNIERLTKFLTALERHLAEAQQDLTFDVYKFMGDGWILLFPKDTKGSALLQFLVSLCEFFDKQFYQQVLRHLGARPSTVGLTFGLEKGALVSLKMYGQTEYVGRAINVACRLQGAVKDAGKSPAYKALVSNNVYNDYFTPADGFKVFRVTRQLRNIRGGVDFHCRKINLFNPPSKKKIAKKPRPNSA
jgi:class 3 adenylate cyclase